MKNISKILTILSFVFLFACQQKENEPKKPKNIILLVSDGTGLSQISSAYFFKEEEPNYSRFENIGFIKTSSSQEDVTDSAAGATAFASGIKTYNGAVGVDADSTSVPTIVELVQDRKIRTGVVATSSIQHATPAAFYGHEVSRRFYENLTEDLYNSDIDYFAGGGLRFFTKRKDSVDLTKKLEEKGFYINTKELVGVDQMNGKSKAGFLLAETAMPKMQEDRGDFLPNATQLGIDFLNNEKGFFLMVEGSQIDWGGHANDASYAIAELIDFDNVIGKALDFAKKDGNTLVIVTSDHETGGFTLSAKKKKREDGTEYSDYSEVDVTFSTGGHSATLIPVFAYGPGSEEFKGIYENNEIFHKIMKVTGWNSKK
ncbi:alkaline phosphatase [Pseudotenacibaculum sp. MALMAid0570]|uniref:alkaline phosphatase n=1 Tax=Pseudotenacibaculum sp. MALMAid0570 TaxID=3143938 RepID=UPI0032DE3E53